MEEDLHTICTRSASLLHTRELQCWVTRGQGPQGESAACQCLPSESTLVRTLPVTLRSARGVTSAGAGTAFQAGALASRGVSKRNCGGCTQRREDRLWQRSRVETAPGGETLCAQSPGHGWSRVLRRSPWFRSLAWLMLSSWLDHLAGSCRQHREMRLSPGTIMPPRPPWVRAWPRRTTRCTSLACTP